MRGYQIAERLRPAAARGNLTDDNRLSARARRAQIVKAHRHFPRRRDIIIKVNAHLNLAAVKGITGEQAGEGRINDAEHRPFVNLVIRASVKARKSRNRPRHQQRRSEQRRNIAHAIRRHAAIDREHRNRRRRAVAFYAAFRMLNLTAADGYAFGLDIKRHRESERIRGVVVVFNGDCQRIVSKARVLPLQIRVPDRPRASEPIRVNESQCVSSNTGGRAIPDMPLGPAGMPS